MNVLARLELWKVGGAISGAQLVLGSRLYRFGVEEALAVMAVVLAAISARMLTSWLALGIRGLRDSFALFGVEGIRRVVFLRT